MLSGKIFCNKCGAPYIADAGTSKSGKVYNYYVCEDKKDVYKRQLKRL